MKDNFDEINENAENQNTKKVSSFVDKRNAIKEELLSWLKPFVFAFVVATIVKSQILVFAEIPSSSMANTIQKEDLVIGNRLAYKFFEPQRGDVVIFKYPDNEKELYIKRLIGLPGDTVRIENGNVYINDSEQPLLEDYVKEAEWGNYEEPLIYEVPKDSYFMLGDNRNNSKDSRAWENTYVTEDKLVARAEFIWFPFTHAKGL